MAWDSYDIPLQKQTLLIQLSILSLLILTNPQPIDRYHVFANDFCLKFELLALSQWLQALLLLPSGLPV